MGQWFCITMCVINFLSAMIRVGKIDPEHSSTRFQVWLAAAIVLGSLQ